MKYKERVAQYRKAVLGDDVSLLNVINLVEATKDRFKAEYDNLCKIVDFTDTIDKQYAASIKGTFVKDFGMLFVRLNDHLSDAMTNMDEGLDCIGDNLNNNGERK